MIGMSAAGTNNEVKAMQAGMDGFLVKPFRLAELMSIITARTGGNSAASGANGHATGTATGHANGIASVVASAFASNAASSNASQQ